MKKRKIILSIVGLIAALISTHFIYQHLVYVATDNAQVEAHSLLLAAKVGGYIKEVRVSEGQKVNKGDALVMIDNRDYENALRQAQSELTSVEARARDSEKNFKRLSELYAKGAVSQQQYDSSATANSEAKAKLQSVQAQLSQAQLNLENSVILAPSNGFVAKKSAEVGQLASPGVPLIGFVGSEERWVTGNFKETDLESIKRGAKVFIAVDAISDREFEGTVDSIGSATGATFTLLPPDNATGNFTKVVQRVPVKIKLEQLTEADIDRLRAGLSAVVRIKKH